MYVRVLNDSYDRNEDMKCVKVGWMGIGGLKERRKIIQFLSSL